MTDNVIKIGIVEDEQKYINLFYDNMKYLKRDNQFTFSVEFDAFILDDESKEEIDRLLSNIGTIDILLIDWEMPQYNAIEILSLISDYIDKNNITFKPICILNSKYYRDSKRCVDSLRAGIDDCITFDKYAFSELASLIADYINKRVLRKDVYEEIKALKNNNSIFAFSAK